ncbi:hypothetical protein BV898_16590 [Hypsibius exemplaris]|uniref:Uncharacterized protein n=1 Tax=Hypsibius exemplaris TaxID=2072580 RepID=A0A9X6RLF0_HYPEX|nr:hypothetical protein BV898_16590 [Hypsibius exemplaris]
MDGKPCVACGSMTVTTVEGKLQTVRMCNVENTPGAEAWECKTDNCNGGPVSALPPGVTILPVNVTIASADNGGFKGHTLVGGVLLGCLILSLRI